MACRTAHRTATARSVTSAGTSCSSAGRSSPPTTATSSPTARSAKKTCPRTLTGADIAEELRAYPGSLEDWWEIGGHEDPLDRVIESYWGNHTLHEVFERETWHTAQHTRQVMMFLEQLGIAPDAPLTADDLAGLPLPERVWD